MLIINIENRNSLYENGKKITYVVFQGESMILWIQSLYRKVNHC